jgi:CheY-like chemotaxis protein
MSVQETTTDPVRKKTVLVIDDNEDSLEISKTILEIDDFEVFTALSGSAAFELLGEIRQPDLILLDMQMPDMSGPEFLLALEARRPDLIENVPVVFHTAMNTVPASKAVGFIEKPYDLDVFLKVVHRHIELGPKQFFGHSRHR